MKMTRLTVISLLVAAFLTFTERNLYSEETVTRGALQRAIGCIAAQRWAIDDLSEIGLKVGDLADVRHETGGIPNVSPASPETTNIMVANLSGRLGVLFFVNFREDGSFSIKRNAYLLQRSGAKWSASEGNGGVGTYEAMSHYAAKLSRLPPAKVRLHPNTERCEVE